MVKNRSLRFKINLSIAATLTIVTLIFGSVLVIYETSRRAETEDQIVQSLTDLTTQYSEQLGNEIFAAQKLAIADTLQQILQRRNLLAISTYDDTGTTLVAAGGNMPELPSALTTRPEAPHVLRHIGDRLFYSSPVVAYDETVGYWQIEYSLATLNMQTLEIIGIFIALLLSLSLLLAVIMNAILKRFVLQPVYTLQNAMQSVEHGQAQPDDVPGDGHLDRMLQSFDEQAHQLNVSGRTQDEIGSLACAFRHMLVALKKASTRIRTDALTGLSNRVKLDEMLAFEISQSRRHGCPFSIILIDIDHFKQINDTHGHLTGDKVLIDLAGLLQGGLRHTDIPGRWGGEEFVIILRHLSAVQAEALAEKLRLSIENHTFPIIGQQVTASFGVTEFMPGDFAEIMIKRADSALYHAKKRGRNQVVRE